MKQDTHPPYREVLFIDSSTGDKFIIGSTLETDEKEVFEGKEYPVYRVAVSSASHPFYTKTKQFMDTEGRVSTFTKKYQRKQESLAAAQQKAKEKAVPPTKKKKKK